MAPVNTDVLDALRAINVPEDKARAAAAALTGPSVDLAQIRGDLAHLRGDLKAEFAAVRSEARTEFGAVRTEFATVRGDLLLLKWMMALSLAMEFAIFLKACAN